MMGYQEHYPLRRLYIVSLSTSMDVRLRFSEIKPKLPGFDLILGQIQIEDWMAMIDNNRFYTHLFFSHLSEAPSNSFYLTICTRHCFVPRQKLELPTVTCSHSNTNISLNLNILKTVYSGRTMCCSIILL